MGYKTTDGLMRHLRSNGVFISGSIQKRQLINTGYFHGYKGYRFFQVSRKRLPFTNYKEIYATIQYDSQLKALFYDKIMFIETAVKNISLQCILEQAHSENIQDIYDRVISSYKKAPPNADAQLKEKLQANKLNLQNMIQGYLVRAYRQKNPKISHFYNNMGYNDVPIWALVEIMTLGDFAYLLSCTTLETRRAISQKIGIDLRMDTNCELVHKYLYTLKDLRNAIAHNAVVFDTRFRNIDPTRAMKETLKAEVKLPYVNFKTIGDYLILTCYFLKILYCGKLEIRAFIRGFERITEEYRTSVNPNVANMVIHPDLCSRLSILKAFI